MYIGLREERQLWLKEVEIVGRYFPKPREYQKVGLRVELKGERLVSGCKTLIFY
jgi:hypothetical protein